MAIYKLTDSEILDLWAGGESGPDIARAAGCTTSIVHNIVSKARQAHDPRAVLRGKGHGTKSRRLREAALEAPALAHAAAHRQRLGKKFAGVSVEDLAALAHASTIVPTRLPLGPHAGWRPSWLAGVR